MIKNLFTRALVALAILGLPAAIPCADARKSMGVVPPTEEEAAAMRAELRQLSTEELYDVIRTPAPGKGAFRREYAITEVVRDGCTVDEVENLIAIAREVGGFLALSIIGPVARHLRSASPTDEEKQAIDRFVDLMEEDAEKESTCVDSIYGLKRVIMHDYDYLEEWRKKGKWPPPPYANDRVIDIVTRCLDHKSFVRRDQAIQALGSRYVGGNDPRRTAEVIDVLKAQRDKELRRKDFDNPYEKAMMLDHIDSALANLEKVIQEQQELKNLQGTNDPPDSQR